MNRLVNTSVMYVYVSIYGFGKYKFLNRTYKELNICDIPSNSCSQHLNLLVRLNLFLRCLVATDEIQPNECC